jgi:hypothetical protein
LQHTGLILGRDRDVFAVGFAQGRIDPDADRRNAHESVVELYYNVKALKWFGITPTSNLSLIREAMTRMTSFSVCVCR